MQWSLQNSAHVTKICCNLKARLWIIAFISNEFDMRKIVSKIAPLGWHAFRILAVMPSGPIALLMSRDRQTRHKQSAIPLCIGHWHLTILISFINPLHIESFWENFRTDFIIFYNFSMSRRSSKIIHRGRQGPTIQWRHNERDGVSNHMRSLFARPFVQEEIKKTSKLRVTALGEGNPPVTGGFPFTKGQ